MLDVDFPSINIPSTSDYLVGQIKHGDANQMTLYSAPLSALGSGEIPWKKICDRTDSVVSYSVYGDNVCLVTSRNAPQFKLVKTSMVEPDFATADVVIPNSTRVVKWSWPRREALYVGVLAAGMNRVLRVGYDSGEVQEIEWPNNAPSGWFSGGHPERDTLLAGVSSWVERDITYFYDVTTGEFSESTLNPRGKYDKVPGYESHEVMVPSHDGVTVPLSIVHKTDITLDGSNPTLLRGYGSYGMVSSPSFDPTNLAWLERGGIYAIAHVRGGGAFGQEWHLAGQKVNKPNTWEDFIACGEYLIEQGYTRPDKLAGQGGSAGGITIGRAITERPDLFGAALINVGDTDMIRAETTTNGVPNIQEFGTVTIEEEFHGLLEMSAYHHVKDGVHYPAVMLTHGINDPRVDPWTSAKMCARLQAASASGKPVLFRVDYHAGHGVGSTKKQWQSQLADMMSFLLWQFGDPDFQPQP